MERLFAPWRIKYIEAPKHEGCIFCQFPREKRDEERLIVYRGKRCFVMMNNYPYNPGHVMVSPYRHAGDLESLSGEEMAEMMSVSAMMVRAIKRTMNPDGFNIGFNIGRVAGAGIEEHIHMHVVPRWNGDTNFMPVLADVRVIPEAVQETYAKLKKAVAELHLPDSE